ncbi:MAG: DUF456 domain-containing protein [Lysobacteraceae bacterium]
MDPVILWNTLAVVLVLVGLAGVVLPVLPGVPILFAGLWLAAWNAGFEPVGFWTLLILAKLTVLSILVDVLASLLGARRVGASARGLAGAAVGTVVGLFMGLVGVLLGPFIGAVLGEMSHGRGMREASRAGVGTWVGLLLGTVAKVAIAFTMLAVFALAWWLGR